MSAPPFHHPDAACLGTDPDLFYPNQGDPGDSVDLAIAVCNTCPDEVHEACLAHALKWREPGIWGGTTGLQRKAMRAQQLTTPPPRDGKGQNWRPVGQTRARILAELAANGRQWTTLHELADILGIQRNTVQRCATRMREEGLIEHEYGGYYRLRQHTEVGA